MRLVGQFMCVESPKYMAYLYHNYLSGNFFFSLWTMLYLTNEKARMTSALKVVTRDIRGEGRYEALLQVHK